MKQLTLHFPYKKVFEAVKQASENLELEIKNASLSNKTLHLFSSGGFFSYGNKIEVEIINSEPSKSILKVSSQSAAVLQVIDWGTNANLEYELLDEVKKILG